MTGPTSPKFEIGMLVFDQMTNLDFAGPSDALARVSDDPANAWRRRDPEVVRSLAALELRSLGLREPSAADDAVGSR